MLTGLCALSGISGIMSGEQGYVSPPPPPVTYSFNFSLARNSFYLGVM